MGLPWIELHKDLPNHPKSIALYIELGDRRAWTYMAQLWLWCADYCESGDFIGANPRDVIEDAAGWRGERGRFVEAATKAGFLKAIDGGFEAVGWRKRAEAHLAKMEHDRERAALRRAKVAKRFRSQNSPLDVRGPSTDVAQLVQRTSKDVQKSSCDVLGNSNPNQYSSSSESAPPTTTPEKPKPEFRLEPVGQKVKKRSDQEKIRKWFEGERAAVLGQGCIPDQHWGVARTNTELKPLTQVSPDLLSGAVQLFFRDPQKRSLDPPCPLWAFARDWPKYVSAAQRTEVREAVDA